MGKKIITGSVFNKYHNILLINIQIYACLCNNRLGRSVRFKFWSREKKNKTINVFQKAPNLSGGLFGNFNWRTF